MELGQLSEDVALPNLESALAAAAPESSDAAILHFALAKSLDGRGEYARSWQHLVAANRIERAMINYDPGTDAAFVERIMAGFVPEHMPSLGGSSERPIFIVGVPRTGSTLVERILGSHSQVHSAGEIPALAEAIEAAMTRGGRNRPADMGEFAEALATLEAAPIAEEYLQRVREYRGDRPRFTDKMLTNFFYCGLIFRAFPRASIVHVTRHPLAACFAIYRTRFVGSYPFAYDLDEIGAFYLCYRRLMAHWHRLFPGRILDVAYEDVVAEVEPTTRRMLDFAGLCFETGCLDFHHNPAPVTTTSLVEVRRPLYDSSLGAWRRYAAQLAPLAKRLRNAGIDCES